MNLRRSLIVLAITTVIAALMAPVSAAARTTLAFTADLADGAKPYGWKLTCDPVGGNHPNRKQACALLAKAGTSLFAPVPKDAACTMIYGGPERVKVTGSVRGKKVNTVFLRSDGCQIARYEKALALFTIPGSTVVRGSLTLDDQPADGIVIFLKDRLQVSAAAMAGQFTVRLRAGTWLGSASIGRSCTPVTLVIDPLAAPPAALIACRSASTG